MSWFNIPKFFRARVAGRPEHGWVREHMEIDDDLHHRIVTPPGSWAVVLTDIAITTHAQAQPHHFHLGYLYLGNVIELVPVGLAPGGMVISLNQDLSLRINAALVISRNAGASAYDVWAQGYFIKEASNQTLITASYGGF